MTLPVKQIPVGDIMESVLIKGDLSKLTPAERSQYYMETCKSLGLNPLTRPFEYITLNGKLQLYALRACTDQLRKINNISVEIISKEAADDILSVHVRAKDKDGRVDEDLGTVAFPASLKGEARANTELKAITKAKRRVTLSICGLGFLDETEVDSIPMPRTTQRPTLAEDMQDEIPSHNPELPAADAPASQTPKVTPRDAGAPLRPVAVLEEAARNAARKGEKEFVPWYKKLNPAQRASIVHINSELRDLMNEADGVK